MKFGLYLPNFDPYGKARLVADLAAEAEEAGWDGFFLWDDIVIKPETEMVDPCVTLTAVAMHTRRIRLGALVTPLPRRRPWKFARETVTLDHLSEGRLVVGVGTGGGPDEWDDFGEESDHRRRGEMLDEGLQVVTGLWSGEWFSHQGKYYHLRGTRFLPSTFQKPRIPIWVGGVWPHRRPLERMARWDGMFPLFFEATSLQEAYNQFCEAVQIVQSMRQPGLPFDIIALGATSPDDPEETARIVRSYAAAGATWWLESIAPTRMDPPGGKPWSFEQLRARVLAGPPTI
uniref:LLM class flavin-dependent oxidoreductase n=1 Tax=Anaerolinea thermolimosa TaxID=229919 RepID=A0A7C4PNA2_9CHLR